MAVQGARRELERFGFYHRALKCLTEENKEKMKGEYNEKS